MANHNQCNFTGRIGKLDIRYTQDKNPISVFSIAIARRLNFDYKVCYELYN